MNREQLLKQKRDWAKRWRKRNPGVQASRSKDWREKHPDEWKAIQKRYRDKNRDKLLAKARITSLAYGRKHRKEIAIKKKEEYRKKKLKENPNWIIKSEKEFWTGIRKKVLKRDNYTCQNCGSKRKLDIHHIDGSGSNNSRKEMNNNINNLITLCHTCHMRLEFIKAGSFNKGEWLEKKERNEMVCSLAESMSQSQIARDMGISRQRVNAIILKRG